LVLLLAVAMSFNPMAIAPALATLVPTTDFIRGNADLSADRARVKAFLARDDVRREFVTLGVDPDEAARRVSAMTDNEIARIAQRLDELPAGEGVVGPIVGAVVLIFIVLLITDILCLTTVFNFTRCAQR
jgi:hypothetical protein